MTPFVQNRPMHDFTLVVPDGAFSSSVTLTMDVLSTAAKLAPRLGLAAPRWRVCGLSARPVQLANGMQLPAQRLSAASAGQGCWIVPGLAVDDAAQLESRLAHADMAPLAAALRRHANKGGVVAASCSAVFVLNNAGLIDGRRVTTTWWLASTLRRMAPLAQVEPERMVHEDGPIITAGAALAHMDLLLHLIRQRFGERLTMAIGQALLVERRRLQSPYMSPALMAPESKLIAQLTKHITSALPAPVSVATLAAQANMSTRTLSRLVSRELGYGPQHLIQSVRVNKARALLENSKLSVEEVASQVGLGDPATLRRLLRRRLNVTPSQIRR